MTLEKAQQATAFIEQRNEIDASLDRLNNKIVNGLSIHITGRDDQGVVATFITSEQSFCDDMRQEMIDALVAQKDAIDVEIGKL